MRKLFLITLMLVFTKLTAPVFADDLDTLPAMKLCIGDSACEANSKEFLDDWKQSFKGNYQAQRNVSYCLSTGCSSAIENKMEGCAWRLLLINRWANGDRSGRETGDSLDGELGNAKWQCGSLSDVEMTSAEALAKRLNKRIHKTRFANSVVSAVRG